MRLLIFSLASLSFACLLGEMYGLWSMRWFGCFVLVPATGVLVWIALRYRRELPARWIVEGALAGILAALAYDLYRLPFVNEWRAAVPGLPQIRRTALRRDGTPLARAYRRLELPLLEWRGLGHHVSIAPGSAYGPPSVLGCDCVGVGC